MEIERTILDTALNGLFVVKTVEKTELPLKDSQEFCIRASVATEILSDSQYRQAKGYSTVAFFGETYDEANTDYMKWLDSCVSDDDAITNRARGVKCMLDELKESY